MADQEIKANDSVAWKGKKQTTVASVAWGLVEDVGEDGTLTIRAGMYRQRITKSPDEIVRHESGPERFHRVYPGSRTGRRR